LVTQSLSHVLNLIAHGTQRGSNDHVGLRQLKAFCSPKSHTVPAHAPGHATWIENPAEGPGGAALNRIGPDSLWPAYAMPVYAFAGKPRAMDVSACQDMSDSE
jgi:hypothetical protein